MNSRLKLKKPSRLEWIILVAVGAVTATLGLWWLISSIVDSQKTYPLGDRLEYVGKQMLPCPAGFTSEGFKFGFCDAKGFYYYATDMSLAETRQYFQNTTVQSSYQDGLEIISSDSFSPLRGLTIYSTSHVIKGSNFAIPVIYIDDLATVSDRIPLKKSTKTHLISIHSEDYKYLFQYAL